MSRFAFALLLLGVTTTSAFAQIASTDPPPSTGATPRVEPAPPAIDPTLLAAAVDEALAHRDGISWKDGFSFKSASGAFELRLGGYTHFDGRFFLADEDDRSVDQFTFRRIRAELKGTILGRAEYRFMPDFAGGRAVAQDAYVDLAIDPAGAARIRAGKFKEPFGLERLQSATAIVFVERALPTTLAPNRDLGVQLWGEVADPRVTWQVGVFNGVPDGGSTDGDVSDAKELAARVFVTPVAGVGVGGAVTWGEKAGTLAAPELPQLKTSGQATFFQYRSGDAIEMTAIADGTHWRATGQAHAYRGPVGVLAEYVRSTQEVSLAGAVTAVSSQAWQVAVDYVIGGDASFKSVAPVKTFDPAKRQWGAFDLAARYHELRVGDEAFDEVADPARSASRARSLGAGVSWYLSKALRTVIDYEATTFEGGAADGADRPTEHVVLGRVQTVF